MAHDLPENFNGEIDADKFILVTCSRNFKNVKLKIFKHFTSLRKFSYANDGLQKLSIDRFKSCFEY